MGLSITAYPKSELVLEFRPGWSWEDPEIDNLLDDDDIATVQNTDFPDRLARLAPGLYRVDERSTFHFEAGSYMAYALWRSELADRALGVGPELNAVAGISQDIPCGPFVLLLDMSDCEGVIGPEACDVLWNDFESLVDDLYISQGPDHNYARIYDNFREAFRVAAQTPTGFVKFH